MNLPKDLLNEAIKASGASTQTDAVVLGLKELIRKKKLRRLVELKKSNIFKLTQSQLKEMRKR